MPTEQVATIRWGDLNAAIGVEDLPDGTHRMIYEVGGQRMEPEAVLALARTVAAWMSSKLKGRVPEGFLAEREFGEVALKGLLSLT